MASVVSIREAMDAAFCSAHARHLRRIDDTGFHQILVLAARGVEPEVGVFAGPDLLDHNGAFGFAVDHELPDGFFTSAAHDRDAELLVALEFQFFERNRSPQQRDAAPGTIPSSTAARVA